MLIEKHYEYVSKITESRVTLLEIMEQQSIVQRKIMDAKIEAGDLDPEDMDAMEAAREEGIRNTLYDSRKLFVEQAENDRSQK